MNTNATLSKRPLGKTGLSITPIGLGGAWLGYNGHTLVHEDGAATVLRALELGVNLIDTSGGYGRGESERIIGMGLAEWRRRGGRREDIVISTKTGTRWGAWRDYSAAATYRSVETSLIALGLDTIYVLLIHDPEHLEPALQPGGALEALKDMKARGLIRAIGLGVRNLDFHRRCIETGDFDVSLTFGDYNLLNQAAAREMLPLAEARGIGVFNGMAIEYGLLGGRDPLEVAREKPQHQHPPQKFQRARAQWLWAQEHGVDLLGLNLHFCVRKPWVSSTLVGAASPDEVEADVQAFLKPIPESIWPELDRWMTANE